MFKRLSSYRIVVLLLLGIANSAFILKLSAQCTLYNINVILDGACPQASEVNWLLVGSDGTLWLSGGAPFPQTICLPDDCYTLQMQDSGGDGWECVDWFISDIPNDFNWDTNLNIGNYGTDQVALGAGDCLGGNGGNNCPPGTQEIILEVDDGDSPIEISWELSLGGITVVSGGPDITSDLCLGNGCFVFELFDTGGNGWENAVYEFTDADGNIIATGTLISGSYDYIVLNIGGLDCDYTVPDDNGGGGGGGGLGCGTSAPGQDCSAAACVCDPFTFEIAPMGFGTFNEIASAGSFSNPSFSGNTPWGGTDTGCLLAGELNSFWMMFSIANSGSLQFSFGQNIDGGQLGFYDWSMWSYTGNNTCLEISTNQLAPVRCVWNATSLGGTGLAAVIPLGGNDGNYGPPLNVLAGEQYIICFSNWSYATGSVTLDFFGTAGIQCGMVLPIDLLEFNAIYQENHAALNWITASELNNDFFEIQHSLDGENWLNIGNVKGAGTSVIYNNYSFEHDGTAPGTNYYRLVQHDFNGVLHYSEVRAIEMEDRSINLYPNPATNIINVSGLNGKYAEIQMYNNLGELIYEDKSVNADIKGIACDLFTRGFYMVIITINGISSRNRIILE